MNESKKINSIFLTIGFSRNELEYLLNGTFYLLRLGESYQNT